MTRHAARLSFALLLLTVCTMPAQAQRGPERWEKDIQKFERSDRAHPPAKGGVVFVGSSSIRMWKTLADDFPHTPTVRRGFGGSQMADALYYADRIVLPYEPSRVVVYEGDNDLAAGKSPKRVLADYRALVKKIHAKLPKAKIGFIAIKPSLARWKMVDKIEKANALIKNYSAADDRLVYLDIFAPMLNAEGTPRKELFLDDGLHMNANGYAVWTKVLTPFVTGK